MNEVGLEEMTERNKLAKSKKKKLELLRDCMNVLQTVTKMKTLEDNLEEECHKLKKKMHKRKCKEEIGRRKPQTKIGRRKPQTMFKRQPNAQFGR